MLLFMKLGVNGADEMIPPAPNMPLLDLISAFDIAAALYSDCSVLRPSPEILFSQFDTDTRLLTSSAG